MHELILFAAPGLYGLAVAARAWMSHRPHATPARGGRWPTEGIAPLLSADGRAFTLASFRGAKAVVVVFMSNRCPGVKAYDVRLRALHRSFLAAGVRFVGVNPVDERLYPSESLEEMARAARERGLEFPYLKDRGQALARALGAVCTPHVFVLHPKGRVLYEGRIDDAFLAGRVRKRYLADVLEDLVLGRRARWTRTQPLGCTIEGMAA